MTLLLLASLALGAETYAGSSYYFGDLHAHTGVSPDGWAQENGNCLGNNPVCGSIAGVFDTARANGLDYVALTDHNNADAISFNTLLARVIAEDSPSFVAIPAVELNFRSTTAHLGHKNLYIFQDNPAALAGLSLTQLGVSLRSNGNCSTDIWTNAAALNSAYGPTLMVAHHPASADVMTTSWSCHNQTYEPVVEVMGGWGDAMTLSPGYDPTNTGGTQAFSDDAPESQATIHAALQDFGLKVGFIGGTDLHDTRPGMTCDRATNTDSGGHRYGGALTMIALPVGVPLSRAAIYGELVGRRSFATSGPRIPVSVAWAGTHGVGEELTVPGGQSTTLYVKVPPAYEGFVQSVTATGYAAGYGLTETAPGEWFVAIANDSIPSWLYVDVKIDGAAFYGSTTSCDDGGTDNVEHIWSSPDWFTVQSQPDADGDGYTTASDCDDTRAGVHPGSSETCDGLDNDCDGTVDVGAADMVAYYTDADGDGYGAGTALLSCQHPIGMVIYNTDCQDTRPRIYPGAPDRRNDGIDFNCDGQD